MENLKLNSRDFFYCYNKTLVDHLKSDGHNVITTAINIKTNTVFTMFEKSIELDKSIVEYNRNK